MTAATPIIMCHKGVALSRIRRETVREARMRRERKTRSIPAAGQPQSHFLACRKIHSTFSSTGLPQQQHQHCRSIAVAAQPPTILPSGAELGMIVSIRLGQEAAPLLLVICRAQGLFEKGSHRHDQSTRQESSLCQPTPKSDAARRNLSLSGLSVVW